MTQAYTPHPYQHDITKHILDTPRCAIWAGMGLGKTVATLTTIDILQAAGEAVAPALVIGPLRVARDVWTKETGKWNHLRDLTVGAVTGSAAARENVLRLGYSIHTVNYENLEWLVAFWGDRWPYRVVVADESTRLKSYRGSLQVSTLGNEYVRAGGSVRARALGSIAHYKVSRFIELTGTPSPNGLKDLWGQLWFLDGGKRLGKTFEAFKQRWFEKGFDGWSLKPREFAQAEIHGLVRDLCLSIDARDYFDIKEPRVNNIEVTLPPTARKHYRDMEKEMFAQIREHGIEAFSAAARTGKCLQLANGAAYVGDAKDKGPRKWVNVHDEKLDALESCLNEAGGMPQIVAYEFKSDLARILARFPKQAVDISKSSGESAFRRGKFLLGCAHPASMGHGLEGLQDVTNIITHFGHSWDLELYDQINGRIGPVRQLQSGYTRSVFHNHIIAAGTVDEQVMQRRESKRSVQDVLLDAMKRKGEL